MESTARGVRVVCRIPNASHLISGVRFGATGDGAMVSEPISDEDAAAFCRNPDFTVDTLSDEVLEAVDRDIDRHAVHTDAPGSEASGANAQLVEELTRANQAQAADLDRMQVELADVKLKLSKSNQQEVDRLSARVAELEAQKDGAGSPELAAEVTQLTEDLGIERRDRAAEKARLEAERDGLNGQLADAQKTVEALTAEKTRLEGEVSTLKQANGALDGERQRIADELALAQQNVADLQAAAAATTDAPAADAADTSKQSAKAKSKS